jgi:hypothetical protein
MSRPAPPVSTLSRILDLVAFISLLLGVSVLMSGGFRQWTPLAHLSVTTWFRPVVIALAAVALRHWLQPRPFIATRALRGVHRAWSAVETRTVFPVWIGTRAGVFVAGFLAISLFGYRPGIDIPWRLYDNEILNMPARWDTGWYLDVALNGYAWDPRFASHQQNIAFFPGYPMLMRYGSLLFGREAMWTGVLISWASFFAALVYLFRLVRERFDADRAAAAVALIACYPFAFFFSTAYTESLFLLTIVAACYHFERHELPQAALWGLAAGLSRPNGCLLSVVLALMAIRPVWPLRQLSERTRQANGTQLWQSTLPAPLGWSRLALRIAVAATPGIGMLLYSAFIYSLTGHPLQWALQNAAWGRVYRSLDSLVSAHAAVIGEHGLYTYAATRTVDSLQVAALVFVLATVWPVYRRLGLPYAVLIVVNIMPPLLMGGLLSLGRVTSVLFPAFVWLGVVIPPAQRPAWLVVFSMLQAICAALFFTWRPLY